MNLKIKKLKDQSHPKNTQLKKYIRKSNLLKSKSSLVKSRPKSSKFQKRLQPKFLLNKFIKIMNGKIMKTKTMVQKDSFQELITSKWVSFHKTEETILLKQRPDMELVMLGVNLDMKNSKTQEESHSRKLKVNSKTKLFKVQVLISIK